MRVRRSETQRLAYAVNRLSETQRLAYAVNRLSDVGLLVGSLGFVILLMVGWGQDWPTAYTWVFPGVMAGSVAIAARVVVRRYDTRPA